MDDRLSRGRWATASPGLAPSLPGRAGPSIVRPGMARDRFIELWTSVRPSIGAYLLARTGDHAVADDLEQETALAAWAGFARLDRRTSFAAWAMGIARHKLADHLRRRRSPLPLLHDRAAADAVDAAMERIGDRIAARAEAMRACLQGLDAAHRDLLDRRYARGQDIAAIAAALTSTALNVKVRLFRIREALRRCIDRRLGRQEDRP